MIRTWHQHDEFMQVATIERADGSFMILVGNWRRLSEQSVWIAYNVQHPDGTCAASSIRAQTLIDGITPSSWRAVLGPFRTGEIVTFAVLSRVQTRESCSPWFELSRSPTNPACRLEGARVPGPQSVISNKGNNR